MLHIFDLTLNILHIGDGICPDSNLCCSQWGWCGNTADHCTGSSCGGGIVGNGFCADPLHCCSEWGYCGGGSAYCGTSPPVSPPAPTPTVTAPTPTVSPPTPTVSGPTTVHTDDARMIAYLGNWQSCPTMDEIAHYTHIVIAFAVSYDWAASKNICSTTCQIKEPLTCNNQPRPDLIAQWQAAGKKVILSFGGAGMGGSWAGDVNHCWEYCYGRETQVVDRLVQLNNDLGLDGIDLDFEYHVTPQAVNFLNQVTTGLNAQLPANAEITHAPMDSDIVPGKPYYDDVLSVSGQYLDFLMPQYYNGITRPALDGINNSGVGAMAALSHYTTIVNNIFAGDATRMVFGFCIAGCSGTGSNANAEQASTVMIDLAATYACNGGAFFWVAEDDQNAAWSSVVGPTIQFLASTGCVSTPNTPLPTSSPTKSPTPLPTTASPTASPVTSAPTMSPSKSPTIAPVTQAPTPKQTDSPTMVCGSLDKETCTARVDCQGSGNGRKFVCSPISPSTPAPTKAPTVTQPTTIAPVGSCAAAGTSCDGMPSDFCCNGCKNGRNKCL